MTKTDFANQTAVKFKNKMTVWKVIFQRELADYFYTPIAYVFLVIFLLVNGILAFYVGNFFEREQADMESFFSFHPWMYLVLAPALGMRLWAEERKTGTIQLLLTMPVRVGEAVFGKFLASWCFAAFALLLTTPMWITVNYLGEPDNGVILASYLGSWAMAGAFLSISSCMSALTRNQVVAFVLAVVVNLVFMLGGFSYLNESLSVVLPEAVINALANMNFLTHFLAISKGVIQFSNIFFFISIAIFFLYLSAVIIEYKKDR